jgi:hypothetical protein
LVDIGDEINGNKTDRIKESLKEYDQKELVHIITELYKLNNEVKDYLSSKFLGEEAINELFEKTKKKVKDEFFPARGHGKLRLSEAKNAIANFKKLADDRIKTIDLMLYYVELGTEFTNSFGDIDARFYNNMVSMYDKVAMECDQDEELYLRFKDRLDSVVHMSDGIGWGYHDIICDIYYSIEWIDNEEE